MLTRFSRYNVHFCCSSYLIHVFFHIQSVIKPISLCLSAKGCGFCTLFTPRIFTLQASFMHTQFSEQWPKGFIEKSSNNFNLTPLFLSCIVILIEIVSSYVDPQTSVAEVFLSSSWSVLMFSISDHCFPVALAVLT